MTNEERQQAIEWLKRRPVMMAGAKRMYDLAVEALEAYVPDMNVGKLEVSCESNTEITRCSDDTISRQTALLAIANVAGFGSLIDLERYATRCCDTWEHGYGLLDAAKAVEALPSAEPRLICCRDCYWWTKQEASLQGRCALTGTYPTGAFFCGNAKQRPYPCDPEKNQDCSKTGCYINGGECRHTLNREYAREEE